MATTVRSSPIAAKFAGQRGTARTSNNGLWVASILNGAIVFSYSEDFGSTWYDLYTFTPSGLPGTAQNASIFADQDDNIWCVWQHTGATDMVYVIGLRNRGAGVWASAFTPQPLFGTFGREPSIIAYRARTGWRVHIVYSRAVNGTTVTAWSSFHVNDAPSLTGGLTGDAFAENQATFNSADISTAPQASSVGSRPSIDFQHIGDGKTPVGVTPAIFIAYFDGVTGVKYRRISYTSENTYQLGTDRLLHSDAALGPAMIFDGTRVVIAVTLTGSPGTVWWHNRDAADTSDTVYNFSPGDGTLTELAVSYADSPTTLNSQDVWFGYVGATSADPSYTVFTRASGTYGSRVALDATTAPLDMSMGRYSPGSMYFVWNGGGGNARFARASINTPPSAPTWRTTYVSDPNLPDPAVHDRSTTLILAWSLHDPDGDPQVSYQLTRSVNGAPVEYWRNDFFDWTSGATTNTTSTQVIGISPTFPGIPDMLGPDAAAVTYNVRTNDGVTWSPWSMPFVVTMSDRDDPVISEPTSSVLFPRITARWTVDEQIRRRVRLYTSTMAQLWDSGWETSSLRERAVDYLLRDQTTYKLTVETRNNEGLAGNTATVTFLVDYVEPATPVVNVFADSPLGAIKVAITNPSPSPVQPAVSSNDLYVMVAPGSTRDDGFRPVGGEGIKLTSLQLNGVFVDWAVASTFDYRYRVRANATNGTIAWSEWSGTTITPPPPPPPDPGGGGGGTPTPTPAISDSILDEDGTTMLLDEGGGAVLTESVTVSAILDENGTPVLDEDATTAILEA